jgi:hypothetical protein
MFSILFVSVQGSPVATLKLGEQGKKGKSSALPVTVAVHPWWLTVIASHCEARHCGY